MAVLSVASLWAVVSHGSVRYSFSGWAPPIGIEWLADPVAAVMAAGVSALGVLCLLYGGAVGDRTHDRHPVPYYTMVLLLLAGLSGAVYAGDLFNIFVFLEVVSLSAYALVAVQGGRALVSAFRYLLMGTWERRSTCSASATSTPPPERSTSPILPSRFPACSAPRRSWPG